MADRYFCELNDDDTCESGTIQFIAAAAAAMPFLLQCLSPSLSLSLSCHATIMIFCSILDLTSVFKLTTLIL
jgi:hypothetical protein